MDEAIVANTPTQLRQIWSHVRPDRLQALLEAALAAHSPSYAEGPALRVFREALQRSGLDVALLPVADESADGEPRFDLVVELGPRPAALLWMGHVDTIAPEPEQRPPLHREGDLQYGLGAADMKGSCAAFVEALAAVVESGMELQRGLTLGLVVGEEDEGDGAIELLRRHSAPLVLIGEPTELRPCLGHYGYLELELRSTGRRAHAALPASGVNAIDGLLAWLERGRRPLEQLASSWGLRVSTREIRGGSELFIVADYCEATLDVHVPPGYDPLEVERIFERTAAELASSPSSPQLELLREYWSAGYGVNPDNPLLDELQRAFSHADLPWRPELFPSHSDGNICAANGHPPVICGPGRLEVAHTADEHISLAQLDQAVKLYTALIYECCIA